jgi:hypothetical protein
MALLEIFHLFSVGHNKTEMRGCLQGPNTRTVLTADALRLKGNKYYENDMFNQSTTKLNWIVGPADILPTFGSKPSSIFDLFDPN